MKGLAGNRVALVWRSLPKNNNARECVFINHFLRSTLRSTLLKTHYCGWLVVGSWLASGEGVVGGIVAVGLRLPRGMLIKFFFLL